MIMDGQIANPFQYIIDRLDRIEQKIDAGNIAPVKDDQVLTAKDAAMYIKSSVQTIRKLINTGQIPHVMIGRNFKVRKSDLDKYLNTNQ